MKGTLSTCLLFLSRTSAASQRPMFDEADIVKCGQPPSTFPVMSLVAIQLIGSNDGVIGIS